MAASGTVLTDDSRLSRWDRALFSVERVLALVSGLAVLSLMLLAVVSVSGRNFFNMPLPGYVDWIEQAMPLIAFMGVSYVQREGGHIRMDMIVGLLRGRALWIVEFVTTFLVLILMLLLVWGSWSHFQRSFGFDMPMWSNDSSMDIALPLWPAKLIVPVAFGVLSLRLILQLICYARALKTGNPSPVGVPFIETAAEQAAREALAVSDDAASLATDDIRQEAR